MEEWCRVHGEYIFYFHLLCIECNLFRLVRSFTIQSCWWLRGRDTKIAFVSKINIPNVFEWEFPELGHDWNAKQIGTTIFGTYIQASSTWHESNVLQTTLTPTISTFIEHRCSYIGPTYNHNYRLMRLSHCQWADCYVQTDTLWIVRNTHQIRQHQRAYHCYALVEYNPPTQFSLLVNYAS